MTDATTKEITKEIATVERSHLNPVFGGILTVQDDTLMTRGGGKGLKLYDDLERDCHVYAVLQKRKMAVIAKDWSVEPASNSALDKRAAEVVEEQFRTLPFDRICLDLLDCILKGYAVSEVIWEKRGNQFAITKIKSRDQRRFVFDNDAALRLLTREDTIKGIELPERKFIVQQFGSKDGNPYGLGLGTRLFWPVFFKRQGLTFWLTFADKFGNPTTVGKYRTGADEAEQRKLLDALQALSHDIGIIIPEEMKVELLEAKRAGSINTHETLARYCDEQISEAVLGETLTTNVGSTGSYAAANTHNEVREELTKADADLQCEMLNTGPVVWITELNVPGANPPRLTRIFEEEEDLNERVKRDKEIHGMGFKPTPDYIERTYGEGWERGAAKPDKTPIAAFAEETGPRDEVDDLTDQVDTLAGDALDGMIEQIRVVVEQANSLEEVSERLLNLYPEMKADNLAELLSKALLLAELQGRGDIANA